MDNFTNKNIITNIFLLTNLGVVVLAKVQHI